MAWTSDLCPHLPADKLQLHSISFFLHISCSQGAFPAPARTTRTVLEKRAEAGLMGALLVCQRGLRPSPSPSVFISISVGPPRIPPHKSQTEKPQVGDGGGGGGGRALESCSVLIKGPPRSPTVTNRARERARWKRRAQPGSLCSVWWAYLRESVASVHTLFLSLSLSLSHTHAHTHTHTHTHSHVRA